jgi:hypothetical protein
LAKQTINPQRTSVAATFYEPIYQRLRVWNDDSAPQLLAFTSPISDDTRRLLEESGAVKGHARKSPCFAEVWEISEQQGCDMTPVTLAKLDQNLARSLGCHNGRFSAECGTMQWSDTHEKLHQRRHVISRLLTESAIEPTRTPRTR